MKVRMLPSFVKIIMVYVDSKFSVENFISV